MKLDILHHKMIANINSNGQGLLIINHNNSLLRNALFILSIRIHFISGTICIEESAWENIDPA